MLGDHDALLLISFGGPEGPDDVMPFLRNVTRGRDVPEERLAEVAEHYHRFGGVSPINQQNRALIAALEHELAGRDYDLPVYWGNRNWHPLLEDTLQAMSADGVRRAVAITTSAFSSYSGCRQYLENIELARTSITEAPEIERVRVYWNHPGFLGAVTDRIKAALDGDSPGRLVFTAHSIPMSMAASCDYARQLQTAAELVTSELGFTGGHDVVYQSRSGPARVPWLDPDINDHLRDLAADGVERVTCVPLGFVSDHLEVVYDLDTEAAQTAHELGLSWARVPAVGTHPWFVSGLVDLVEEAAGLRDDRPTVGGTDPMPDACPVGCCPAGARPGRPRSARGA